MYKQNNLTQNMNTQTATVTTAAVTQKKRGRKRLWETDPEEAMKKQWKLVMRDVKKEASKTRKPVPIKCEVVALLTAQGEVIQKFGAVIGDAPKQEPTRKGRKSLWETDPEAAATREVGRWLAKVPAPPKSKVVGGKKRGRRGLWVTDYDAAVKRQWDRVMKELPKTPKEGKLKAGVLERYQAKSNESKQLKKARVCLLYTSDAADE